MNTLFLAQESVNSGAAAGVAAGAAVFFIIYFAIAILMIASLWKVFTKAGKPGWASIVPIYSTIVLLEIVNKPIWWIILFIVPVVQIVIAIMICAELANRFGKGGGYTVGLILLPIIFLPMLAFGDASYQAVPEAPVA